MRSAIFFLLAAALVAGCHGDTKSATPPLDPERASGPDRQRAGATPMPTNTPVTDDVSWPKGDATDWKMVTLAGNPGLLEVRLHWDNAASDLLIDVFNANGDQIASSPGLQPGSVEKRVTVEIPAPGQYFLRVSANAKDDASVYTLSAAWAGPPAPVSPVVVANPDTPDASAPTDEETKPNTEAPSSDDDDRGLQGRIVSSYRENGQLVLHLDKGSAAGVTVGKHGAILEGPTGTEHLTGGDFTITEVVDRSRSIAKSDLKTVGHNNRIIIYVGH